jgi:hypothetical protein
VRSVATAERRKMTTTMVVKKRDNPYVIGPRPTHKHTCTEGEHPWLCNSPYCNHMEIECPEHGGPVPVIEGFEPWRGR